MTIRWQEGDISYEVAPLNNMPGFYRVSEQGPNDGMPHNQVMQPDDLAAWLAKHPAAPPLR